MRSSADAYARIPIQPVTFMLIALLHRDLNGTIAHLDSYRISWGWADPLVRSTVYTLRGNLDLAAGEYRAVFAAFPGY